MTKKKTRTISLEENEQAYLCLVVIENHVTGGLYAIGDTIYLDPNGERAKTYLDRGFIQPIEGDSDHDTND